MDDRRALRERRRGTLALLGSAKTVALISLTHRVREDCLHCG
jgi:hypothetical protein